MYLLNLAVALSHVVRTFCVIGLFCVIGQVSESCSKNCQVGEDKA